MTVTTGMETDYYIEVQGDDLQEGLQVVIPTDKTDKTDSRVDPAEWVDREAVRHHPNRMED